MARSKPNDEVFAAMILLSKAIAASGDQGDRDLLLIAREAAGRAHARIAGRDRAAAAEPVRARPCASVIVHPKGAPS